MLLREISDVLTAWLADLTLADFGLQGVELFRRMDWYSFPLFGKVFQDGTLRLRGHSPSVDLPGYSSEQILTNTEHKQAINAYKNARGSFQVPALP